MRVTEMGASEGCLVTGQIEVASPRGDKITSPETELTSRWCSSSRPLEEPMYEAKQMTTGQPVGAASHTSGGFSTAVRIGSQSVSSRSYSFESGRVLVFQGGVIERSSRMRGNLQVRFLEGWASAMAPGYSTLIRVRKAVIGGQLPTVATHSLLRRIQRPWFDLRILTARN